MPLVSIIIPCFNQGRFLDQCIKSVIEQSWKHHEIIVVDDGSDDNTREVASAYPAILYTHQANMGVSSARNLGISIAKGEFLVFLDADDWLLPMALETNLKYLTDNPTLAFVSGSYYRLFHTDSSMVEVRRSVNEDHYCHFLEVNYIGVPAAAMFRRWVFDLYLFDGSVNGVEDYDLYLRVSRSYPVFHHQQIIAVYREHENNASNSVYNMYIGVMKVLERQHNLLRDENEREWYKKGIAFWNSFYGIKAFDIFKYNFLASNVSVHKEDHKYFKQLDTKKYSLIMVMNRTKLLRRSLRFLKRIIFHQ